MGGKRNDGRGRCGERKSQEGLVPGFRYYLIIVVNQSLKRRENTLPIEDTGPRQIFFRRIVDKKAGSILQHGNDRAGHFFGNGRAAERGSHHSIFMEDPLADIGRSVYHDVSFKSFVVNAPLHSVDAKGQAIVAEIRVACYIEAKAALIRFGRVGK